MKLQLLKLATAILAILPSLAPSAIAQDRNPDLNVVFPERLYYHNGQGNRILDLTQAPFNANGKDNKDDTAAFIKALNFIAEKGCCGKSKHSLDARSNFIYLPDGKYLVSDTLRHSLPLSKVSKSGGSELTANYRIIGQSKQGTIIRLQDNSRGFDNKNNPKPVLETNRVNRENDGSGSNTFSNNVPSSNFIENLTIDVGRDNPGAAAIDYHAANSGAIRNVRLVAPNGSGAIGLNLYKSPSQGIFQDITVNGFDIGIHAFARHASSGTFDHITLRGQNRVGFLNVRSSSSIRKLTSFNSVPAIALTRSMPDEAYGHVVLLDSELISNGSSNPAIALDHGVLMARNVQTKGYQGAIKKEGRTVWADSRIGEYVSEEPKTVFGNWQKSLNLPIEDTPGFDYWEDNLSGWISVKETGAKGDGKTTDTKAIQAAMNSGKPVVYFETGNYQIDDTIEVPPSVKMVLLNFANFDEDDALADNFIPIFKTVGDSKTPVIFAKGFNFSPSYYKGKAYLVGQGSRRPVVLKDLNGRYTPVYTNLVGGAIAFFENVNGGIYLRNGARAWARYINNEDREAEGQYRLDDATLWVAGFKTEKGATGFNARNGSTLEVLGGDFNEASSEWEGENRAVVVDNSNVSLSAHFNNNHANTGKMFEEVMVATQGGQGRKVERNFSDWPTRIRNRSIVVPLLVSTTGGKERPSPSPTPEQPTRTGSNGFKLEAEDAQKQGDLIKEYRDSKASRKRFVALQESGDSVVFEIPGNIQGDLEIGARGLEFKGKSRMRVEINGKRLTELEVGTKWDTYRLPNLKLSQGDEIAIIFTNDLFEQGKGDRDVLVDFIEVKQ